MISSSISISYPYTNYIFSKIEIGILNNIDSRMILFPIKFSDNAEYNELVNCDQPYASTLDSSAQNRLKIDCLLILTKLWLLKDVSVCHHNDTSILKRIVVS